MYCLKISKDSIVIDAHEFSSYNERKQFLLGFRFVDGGDVWYHPFNGKVAGLFYRNPGEEMEASACYTTCDMRVQKTKGIYLG